MENHASKTAPYTPGGEESVRSNYESGYQLWAIHHTYDAFTTNQDTVKHCWVSNSTPGADQMAGYESWLASRSLLLTAGIGVRHYSIPSLVYPQVRDPGSAMICLAGIPSQDRVPLEWAALWENPQMMRVEGERGMSFSLVVLCLLPHLLCLLPCLLCFPCVCISSPLSPLSSVCLSSLLHLSCLSCVSVSFLCCLSYLPAFSPEFPPSVLCLSLSLPSSPLIFQSLPSHHLQPFPPVS